MPIPQRTMPINAIQLFPRKRRGAEIEDRKKAARSTGSPTVSKSFPRINAPIAPMAIATA